MKRIVAYVNTVRVHWLVEELRDLGIHEIMVTEYFRPLSEASRFEFLCEDDKCAQARTIIHRIGTCGSAADHFIEITEFIPAPLNLETLGKYVSPLEQ